MLIVENPTVIPNSSKMPSGTSDKVASQELMDISKTKSPHPKTCSDVKQKKSNKGSYQGPQNDPQQEPKKPAKKKGQHPSSLTEKESKRGKFQTLNDPQQKAYIKEKDSQSSRIQALPENPLQQSSELVKNSRVHPKQTKSCPHVEEKASNASDVQTLPEDP